MNENGKNKREWVKTAAIIFLSVMLVLTFFANTIMNYSLPEVATSYAQSGSITAKIRGTGVVESGDPYEVKVNESRKIASVAVRVGDKVEKGDVLLYLEDVESEELKKARKDLETAKKEYELALLTAEISSSNIFSANEGVSAEVYRQQITNAQAAVEKAEKAYDAAVDAVTAAEKAVTPYEQKVAQLTQTISDYKTQSEYERSGDVAARDEKIINDKKAALDSAENELINAGVVLENARAKYNSSVSSGDAAAITSAQAEVQNAETIYNNVKNKRDNAQNEYNNAVNTKNNRETAIINLNAAAADLELQKYGAEKELAAAQAVVEEKKTAVTAAQAVVEEKKADLNELVGNISNVTGLEKMLDTIADAQKLVEELSANSYDATVTADISGTVTEIMTAGNTTSPASPVAVLQPEGAGFTLSFSVTNDQAKRLSVGDRADLVNAWWYDDVEVTLASIKPDKNDPGQRKQLTFNVTGSVTAGQSFNISVGQKSANYDLIVPNSAIREDSNGKFVLILEEKPSPLGTRYVATRVDVEVLASDDTQSAVSGGLVAYDYVITTSNKPVEAGKLVRLPD